MALQSFKMAMKAIAANKTRSFLTMLGIIIGVYSLVVLVSLVDGVTNSVTSVVQDLGNGYIIADVYKDKGKPLNNEDLTELSKLEHIQEVSPLFEAGGTTFTANGKEDKGTLFATDNAYFRLEGLKTLTGRIISPSDVDSHLNVADLGYETALKLFNSLDCVGETIKVNGVNYEIIGVLEKQKNGFQTLAVGNGLTVYVPYTAYTRQPGVKFNGFPELVFSIESMDDMEAAKNEISSYYYKRFDKDMDAYEMLTQDDLEGVIDSITGIMSVLFGGVAAISLLVGGIGIMNIMLVSVTERTKEIGIRKAIGANKRSILLQFLIEAFSISLTGCVIALILSYITVGIANLVVGALNVDMSFHVPFTIVLTSVGFSLLVGLAFGLYPANKAANKKPIEALHYDG